MFSFYGFYIARGDCDQDDIIAYTVDFIPRYFNFTCTDQRKTTVFLRYNKRDHFTGTDINLYIVNKTQSLTVTDVYHFFVTKIGNTTDVYQNTTPLVITVYSKMCLSINYMLEIHILSCNNTANT